MKPKIFLFQKIVEMTHYNAMQGSGYTEPEVPPSQDLEDDDPTVYQVRKYLKFCCRF